VIFFGRKFEKYDFKQKICIEKMTQIRQISKERKIKWQYIFLITVGSQEYRRILIFFPLSCLSM
jgi:hypothetical protein